MRSQILLATLGTLPCNSCYSTLGLKDIFKNPPGLTSLALVRSWSHWYVCERLARSAQGSLLLIKLTEVPFAGLFCGSFLRNGEVLAHVGRGFWVWAHGGAEDADRGGCVYSFRPLFGGLIQHRCQSPSGHGSESGGRGVQWSDTT